jgi:hypothetical protein
MYSDGTNVYFWNGASWDDLTDVGSGSLPSGAEGQLLYNNAGTWTAFDDLYWDDIDTALGIGHTNPQAKLDIEISDTWDGIALRTSDTSAVAFLLGDDLNNGTLWLYPDNTQPTVQISANSAETTWFNAGNVGIGTSEPLKALHVIGEDGAILSSTAPIGSKDTMIIENNGNASLTIVGSTSSNVSLKFTDPDAELWQGLIMYNLATDTMILSTSGTADNFIGIDSQGRMGIGTTAPTQLFTLSSSTAWGGLNMISDDGNNTFYIGNDGDQDGALVLYDNSTNEEAVMLRGNSGADSWINSGNLGIGTTSPTEKLDVDSDTIRIRGTKTPASQTEACEVGEMAWDTNYIYVCTSTDNWARATLGW